MSKSTQSDVTSEINKKADKEIEKQFGDYYKKENLELLVLSSSRLRTFSSSKASGKSQGGTRIYLWSKLKQGLGFRTLDVVRA